MRVSVGDRVVVRYRRRDAAEAPPLSDVIGMLTDLSPDAVTVERESGVPVVIPRADVVACKAVPRKPVRASEIRALEHAAADAWPGVEQELVGGWLLRAGRGVSLRANSALPVDPTAATADLLAALPAVVRWYARRGLVPRLHLPDRLLRTPAGWRAGPDVVVLTAPATVHPTSDSAVAATPDASWSAHHPRFRDVPEVLTAVRNGEVAFLSRRDASGTAVSVARAAVTATPAGTRVVSIAAVATHPDHRRRGHAAALCRDAVSWGAERGAVTALVQVESGGDAAALYAGLGFGEHHRYRYAEPEATEPAEPEATGWAEPEATGWAEPEATGWAEPEATDRPG
ncbi:N-acetylglutamate synthase, CG3035 family [Rhodococcoides corynebacterioides]|uniref:N-acetylglutamate synthase, CG3035 family n=1 Tax=Rhodococcoides corynebacterioides TaxID=53972 RepID=UPI001DBAC67D|nr:GNAT family N-acetyltransferase [Rhodococcus corynebacterioides]MBY6362684.1 GNAT family N-acetyltransferase [Rhodococcus corynebacterioides]